jgi:hypothetical protein
MKPECKGCRQRKDIVYHIRGMGYCKDCEHKAPTQKQFHEYLNPDEYREAWNLKPFKKFGSREDVNQ